MVIFLQIVAWLFWIGASIKAIVTFCRVVKAYKENTCGAYKCRLVTFMIIDLLFGIALGIMAYQVAALI